MAGPTSPLLARLRGFWQDPRNRRKVGLTLLGGSVFFVFLLLGVWTRACAGDRCPSVDAINGNNEDQASLIFAADGRQIGDFGLFKRTVMPLKQMSPAVPAAFLAIEDRRFYEHHGVDWVRFFGTIKNLVTLHGLSQGFSTITMQLARNLFPEEINARQRGIRGIPRKVREVRVALQLEKKFQKEQILEMYLNKINLGNSAYGVEAAARRYFGKSASNVNLAEAASLAALAKSPEFYNPRKHPLAAVQRRNLVIEAMHDAGYLTAEEAEGWKAYPLTLAARSDYQDVAEYFVEYVRQIVQAKFGREVYTGGLRIYTTLDLDAQQAAVSALSAQLEKIEANGITGVGKFSHPLYRDYIDKKTAEDPEKNETPYLQGGAVVLEAKTGNILALVGGRDFGDSKFNRMTQAFRQPGSSFKPIVYTTAVQNGLSFDQTFKDAAFPVQLGPNQDPWVPRNYEQHYSDSILTVREGLWQSKNTIAVRAGLSIAPTPAAASAAVVEEARKFGITTLKDEDAVPSIFLGSAALHPMELIAGYTVFANLGARVVPNAILRVEDRTGKNIWPVPVTAPIPVLDPGTASTMNQALQGVVTHGTAASSVGAVFKVTAGGKTGTTSDYHDVWFIGFTKDLVAGVWMGFDNPQPIMKNAQGAKLAAPAWAQMMNEIYQRRKDPGSWGGEVAATDSVSVEVDKTNGLRATPFCPQNLREMRKFAKGSEPKEFCPIHSPFRPGGGGGT